MHRNGEENREARKKEGSFDKKKKSANLSLTESQVLGAKR
jgi:hypothetical protein